MLPRRLSWRLWGKAAKELGSKDPLVAICYAYAVWYTQGGNAAIPLINAAIPELRKSEYTRLYLVLAHHWLFAINAQKGESREQLVRNVCAEIAQWIEHESNVPSQRGFIWKNIRIYGDKFALWERRILYRECLKCAHADHWILHMLAGDYYVKVGWEARGTGVASSVSKEGWRVFHEDLQKARYHFCRAWEIDPGQPVAASEMITVAKAGGDPIWSPRDWFLCAVEAQFDYLPAYDSMMDSLRPRWCGSHQAMLQFGRECLATKRFDTNVPLVLRSVLYEIQKELGQSESAWGWPGIYELFREMAEGYQTNPLYADNGQPSTEHTWIQSYLAAVAVESHRYDDARRVLEALGERVERGPFLRMHQSHTYATGLVFALTGKTKDTATQIKKLLDQNEQDTLDPADIGPALTLIEQVRSKETDSRAIPFYDHARVILERLKKYHDGEWCDLTFDSSMLGWYVLAPEWEVEDAHSIRLSSRQTSRHWNGRIQVRSVARFPPPYRVEVDVEHLDPQPFLGFSGILLGDFDANALYTNRPGKLFGISKGEQAIGIIQCGIPPESGQAPLSVTGPVRLCVRAWPGCYHIFTDWRVIEERLVDKFQPDSLIAFGEGFGTVPRHYGEVRFRNARIRKIRCGIPPSLGGDDVAGIEEYFAQAVGEEPDNPRLREMLGIMRFHTHKCEEALEHLLAAQQIQPALPGLDEYLGFTYHDLFEHEKAKQCYIRALKQQPDIAAVRNQFARLLATSPDEKIRDGKEALRHATAICQDTEYKNWDYLSSLAAAHAELGQFDEAVKWGKQALEMAPEEHRSWVSDALDCYESKRAFRNTPRKKEQQPASPEDAATESEAANESEAPTESKD